LKRLKGGERLVPRLFFYKKKAATAAPMPANAGTCIIWAAPVASSRLLEVGEADAPVADSESEPVEDSESEPVAAADREALEVTVDREAVTEALLIDTVAAAVALGSESPPSVMRTGNMLK
jgi:hypothetical protein